MHTQYAMRSPTHRLRAEHTPALVGHAVVEDGRNDIITFVNPTASGYTHNEDIIITKNNVHLRAASRDITFKAATPNGTILTIGDGTGTNGYSCSIQGLLIDGDKNGAIPADYCIQVNGKFCNLDSLWLKQSVLDCLRINGGDYHVINNAEYEKAGRHGISTFDAGLPSGSPREISIVGRSNIYINAGDGIHLGVSGTPVLGSTTRLIRILSGEITRNTGYGIHAEAEVDGLTISNIVITHDNNGGPTQPQLNILTTEVHNDREEHHIHQADAVWDKPISEITDTSTIGYWVTNKLLSIKKFLGLK